MTGGGSDGLNGSARVVHPGHGPSFGRRRLRAIIDRYLKERS
jgi:hypothetical protein